jgi:hypothetical protein
MLPLSLNVVACTGHPHMCARCLTAECIAIAAAAAAATAAAVSHLDLAAEVHALPDGSVNAASHGSAVVLLGVLQQHTAQGTAKSTAVGTAVSIVR